MKNYVGDFAQIRGAEELVLQNSGKGNGMRFLYLRNGLGLEVFLSLDRAGDVARVNFKGDNIGYYSSCGFVSPLFFDGRFLENFTGGFLTTCGFENVGPEGEENSEYFVKHGTISSTSAKICNLVENEEGLTIKLTVKQGELFGRKIVLQREFFFSYLENVFTLKDEITNVGDQKTPFMALYHCNVGYPLLSESARLKIHGKITPYNDFAAQNIDNALVVNPPTSGYRSRCYYYDVEEKNGFANVGIFNSGINKGLVISYDKSTLPNLTQWKLLGFGDYVMGLEPCNCTIDGRISERKNGTLKELKPNESVVNTIKFTFTDSGEDFEGAF